MGKTDDPTCVCDGWTPQNAVHLFGQSLTVQTRAVYAYALPKGNRKHAEIHWLICHTNSPFMPLGNPEYSPLLPPFGIPALTSRARVILTPQPALLGRTACADVGEPSSAFRSSSTPNKANNRGGDPAMGSRSIPWEQREEGRSADWHSGDREPDAKQESQGGSLGVWMTHAGIKRGGRTRTEYPRYKHIIGTG